MKPNSHSTTSDTLTLDRRKSIFDDYKVSEMKVVQFPI